MTRHPKGQPPPHHARGPGSPHVPHRLLAGLLATAARAGANAAVLVLPRVAPALLSAQLAGGRAKLKHLPQDLLIGARPPRRQGAGGGAHVRAVEIEPDALPELLDHFLSQAGIGAGSRA